MEISESVILGRLGSLISKTSGPVFLTIFASGGFSEPSWPWNGNTVLDSKEIAPKAIFGNPVQTVLKAVLF